MTDPLVSLNGVTATLTDGSVVQFLSQGKATITGAFTTALAQYDVVDQAKAGGYALINSLDIAVNADSQAVLAEATKVMDPATAHLRDLAAGTQLSVPAGSIVQLPLATVVPVDPASVVTSLFNLPAVFITLAVTMLLVLGVSESALVNNIIVAIKVTVILAFIAVGAFFVNPDNWHPFIPEPTGVENQFGIDGVIRAATIVFFAYIGFEAVSTAGQEAQESAQGHAHRHPGLADHLHRALHGSPPRCSRAWCRSPSSTWRRPWPPRSTPSGREWGWLAKCIKIGAIAGLSSVVLVLMFGQTRVFYSMSRDGLLPKTLAKVHPKFKTPWINTLIVGVLVSLAAAVFDINKLGDLTSVGTLVAFGLVCFSVIWLRAKRPDLPRHFKVWGYPVIPAIGVVLCFVLAWIGVEHAIRVWFGWFLRRDDRGVFRLPRSGSARCATRHPSADAAR